MGNNLTNFQNGEQVVIGIKEQEVIEQMQQMHGGWNAGMTECMKGPCTIVQGIGTDALVKCPSGNMYRLNPDLLVKYERNIFESGKKLTIIDDEEKMKGLQSDHGGWSDAMRQLLGQSVDIVQQFSNGDIQVTFAGRLWTVNQLCFDLTKKPIMKKVAEGDKVKILADKEIVKARQHRHGGWAELMSLFLGQEVEVVKVMEDGDCYVAKHGMTYMFNQQCFENYEEEEEERDEKCEIRKGDLVKVSDNLEICKALQHNHGGWVPGMKVFMGKEAVVDGILPTGDAKVTMSGMSFVFNINLLTKVSRESDTHKKTLVFSVGDRVKVLSDKKKVKALQKDHGEWVHGMKMFLGEKGKVQSIFPDGDLRVKMLGNEITLNPECVTKVESDNDSDDGVPDMLKMMTQLTRMLGANASDKSDDNDDDEDEDLSDLFRGGQLKMIEAVKKGDMESTQSLVDLVGPNFSVKNISPLLVAVNEGHEAIVTLLLSKGATVTTKNIDGETALHLAVQLNRLEICKILLSSGVATSVNDQNDKTLTPLMMAAVTGKVEILKCLVAVEGVDLNIGDNDNDTALHLAVQTSRLESVVVLLEAGADIRAVNKKQFNAYHLAVLRGHEKILEAFLKRPGPSIVDIQKEDNFAALHLAAINNHCGCLRLLIKYKADLNIRNGKLQTALHIAVGQKYLECVRILVENKADMNLRDESGDTPIHDAVRGHNMERMKNIGAQLGLSAMFSLLAVVPTGSDSCEDIVLYLVRQGANLTIANNLGKTAIALCDDDLLKAKMMSINDGTESVQRPPVVTSAPASATTPVALSTSTQAELDALRLQIEKLEKEKICKICGDRPIDITFPCGHGSCEPCAKNIYNCHDCREPVDNFIKTFR